MGLDLDEIIARKRGTAHSSTNAFNGPSGDDYDSLTRLYDGPANNTTIDGNNASETLSVDNCSSSQANDALMNQVHQLVNSNRTAADIESTFFRQGRAQNIQQSKEGKSRARSNSSTRSGRDTRRVRSSEYESLNASDTNLYYSRVKKEKKKDRWSDHDVAVAATGDSVLERASHNNGTSNRRRPSRSSTDIYEELLEQELEQDNRNVIKVEDDRHKSKVTFDDVDHIIGSNPNDSFHSVESIGEFDSSHRKSKRINSALKGTSTVTPRLKSVAQHLIATKRVAEYKQSEEGGLVPSVVGALWRDVARNIRKSEQSESADHVNNKTIYDALETSKRFYIDSADCRTFIDNNLSLIMQKLLSQSPHDIGHEVDKLGLSENQYVEKSIRFALQLIIEDLKLNAHKFTISCRTLEALVRILHFENRYYEASPIEVRMEKIFVFQRGKGFNQLAIYFNARSGVSEYIPNWNFIHRIVEAAHEGILFLHHTEDTEFMRMFRKDAMNMAGGAMKLLRGMKNGRFAKMDVDLIRKILSELKVLFEQLAVTNPKSMPRFFSFCQDIIYNLLVVDSEEHKRLGKEMLYTLIQTIHGVRPLTSAYVVKQAGVACCDGMYTISSADTDKDGFLIPGLVPRYERTTRTNQKLLLFLDTEQKSGCRWCLSEEHRNEAIFSEYTDYYANNSDSYIVPPLDGWIAIEESEEPAPALEPAQGTLPIRKEHTTLMYDFARWFLQKHVAKLVLGLDIKCSTEPSSITKLVEAISAYVDGNDKTDQTTNMIATILPSISINSTNYSSDDKSISQLELLVQTAKQNLTSAESWKETTSEMLRSAQNENAAALAMIEKAREYLASLEEMQGMNIQSLREHSKIDKSRSLKPSISELHTINRRHSSSTKLKGKKKDRRMSMNSLADDGSVRSAASSISDISGLIQGLSSRKLFGRQHTG